MIAPGGRFARKRRKWWRTGPERARRKPVGKIEGLYAGRFVNRPEALDEVMVQRVTVHKAHTLMNTPSHLRFGRSG